MDPICSPLLVAPWLVQGCVGASWVWLGGALGRLRDWLGKSWGEASLAAPGPSWKCLDASQGGGRGGVLGPSWGRHGSILDTSWEHLGSVLRKLSKNLKAVRLLNNHLETIHL